MSGNRRTNFFGSPDSKVQKSTDEKRMTVNRVERGEAYALYFEQNNSLVFTRSIKPIQVGNFNHNKLVTEVFTRFEDRNFNSLNVPWVHLADRVCEVVFEREIEPISTAYWFNNFSKCISVDLRGLNTSRTENISSMFNGCANLEELIFGKINLSKVKYMTNVFKGCTSLEELPAWYVGDAGTVILGERG